MWTICLLLDEHWRHLDIVGRTTGCVIVNDLLIRWHGYTIGTLDVLQACDACADMGMAYSVIVQCADCVIFLSTVVHAMTFSSDLINM